MDIQDSVEDLQISVCSILYYLYRNAGCPYGDTNDGMMLWMDIQQKEWENLLFKSGLLSEKEKEELENN